MPQVSLEQRTRLFHMPSSLFSRYIECGNQSSLESSITPRYFILKTTFNFQTMMMGWLPYFSLFLMNIGITADFSLEMLSLFCVLQSLAFSSGLLNVLRTSECCLPDIMSMVSSAKMTIRRLGMLDSRFIK